MLQHVEFVACMSDVRAQRTVKLRLEALQKIEKQKKEKVKEEKLRLEKVNQKEKQKELRKQQRREVRNVTNASLLRFHRASIDLFHDSIIRHLTSYLSAYLLAMKKRAELEHCMFLPGCYTF